MTSNLVTSCRLSTFKAHNQHKHCCVHVHVCVCCLRLRVNFLFLGTPKTEVVARTISTTMLEGEVVATTTSEVDSARATLLTPTTPTRGRDSMTGKSPSPNRTFTILPALECASWCDGCFSQTIHSIAPVASFASTERVERDVISANGQAAAAASALALKCVDVIRLQRKSEL